MANNNRIKLPYGATGFMWRLYRERTGLDVTGRSFADIIEAVTGERLTKSAVRRWVIREMAENPGLAKRRTERKSKAERKAAKKARQDFYESREWRTVRYHALKEHGASCLACGRSAKDGVVIHVDHIKPRSKYPELELDVNNLQILCADCNLGKGAWDETDWR